MSESLYFGSSFALKKAEEKGPGEYYLVMGDHPGEENFAPNRQYCDAALIGLVDTLRVTRKLLKEALRQKGVGICAGNGFNRQMVGIAKKVDESPEDVTRLSKIILSELFEEMVAKQAEKK